MQLKTIFQETQNIRQRFDAIFITKFIFNHVINYLHHVSQESYDVTCSFIDYYKNYKFETMFQMNICKAQIIGILYLTN